MPCWTVKLPNGSYAIVHGSRKPVKLCTVCGGPGGRLCDFPTGTGKTCDASLCGRCAVPIAKDVEYCPSHPRRPKL